MATMELLAIMMAIIMIHQSKLIGADFTERLVLPGDCSHDQYYDSTQMMCTNCSHILVLAEPQPSRYSSSDYTMINTAREGDTPADGTNSLDSLVDGDDIKSLPRASDDHLTCQCPQGYFKSLADQRHLFRCVRCPAGTVTSYSGYECAKCLQHEPQQPPQPQPSASASASPSPSSSTSTAATAKPSTMWMSLVRPLGQIMAPNNSITAEPTTMPTASADQDAARCVENCHHLKNSFMNERLSGEQQLERYCHQCPKGTLANQLGRRCDPCHESLLFRLPLQQQRLSARYMQINGTGQPVQPWSSISCRCDESEGYSILAGICMTQQSHQSILNDLLMITRHNTNTNSNSGLDTPSLTYRQNLISGIDLAATPTPSDGTSESAPGPTNLVLNRARFYDGDELPLYDGLGGDTNYLQNDSPSLSSHLARSRYTPKVVNSDYLAKHLIGAIDQCKNHQNLTACQIWSNMCVMAMYTYNDLHQASQSTGGGPSSPDWAGSGSQAPTSQVCNYLREHLKKSSTSRKSEVFDIYIENDALDELYKINIPSTYKINQEIQFIAFRWNRQGRLLDASELKLAELSLCHSKLSYNSLDLSSPDTNKILVERRHQSGDFFFGRNHQELCDITVRSLIDRLTSNNNKRDDIEEKHGIFYEIYLVVSTGEIIYVRPVPILIKNLVINGQHVNRNEDISRWRLVKRFFLADIVGSSSFSYNINATQARRSYLRYPKSIDLNIRMRKRDGTGAIYPPLFTIDYESLEVTNILNNNNDNNNIRETTTSTVRSEMRVTYSMSNSNLEKNAEALVGLLCLLSGFWSLIKCYTWCRRCGKTSIDLGTIFQYFIMTGNTMANLFLLAIFTITLYCLLVFKFQTSVQTLLPTKQQESSLISYMNTALVFKSLGLINQIYYRLNSDVFFIDWERPKQQQFKTIQPIVGPSAATTTPTTTSATMNHDNQNHHQLTQAKARQEEQTTPGFSHRLELSSHSIWRCYFIFNRWMYLQTKRRLNITLQLFAFLVVFQLIDLTSLTNNKNNLDHAPVSSQINEPPSLTCRLAIIIAIYSGLAVSQILFHAMLYEPLVKDTVREFVDLCSISNMSLFGMLYPKYGYYIHGRSANGMAECNLQELNEFLEREERDLCSKRGLAPNTDQQTFQMLLPSAINEHYHKLLCRDDLSGVQTVSINGLLGANFENNNLVNNFSLSSFNRPHIDRLVARHWLINRFLINFIDHGFKDLDYTIRDKKTSEVLLDTEIEEHRDSAHFYNDGTSFISLIWLGMELDLVIFELMMVIVVDIWLNNVLAAVIITWVVNRIMKLCYCNLTRQNLVTKALIDDKFLVY